MADIDLELIDPKNTAVLVVDMQNAYCSPTGSMVGFGYDVSPITKIVPDLNSFLDEVRNHHLPVIFTRMIEDEKYMSENAAKKMQANKFDAVSSPGSTNMDYFGVAPELGDLEIIKNSYDAFSNLELEKSLLNKHIKNLIIVGVNMEVCVDTTLRSAYSRGYNVVVPRELVATTKQNQDKIEWVMSVWDKFFAHIYDQRDIINSWKENEG